MLSYRACSCLLQTLHFRTPQWSWLLGSCRHQCRFSQHISEVPCGVSAYGRTASAPRRPSRLPSRCQRILPMLLVRSILMLSSLEPPYFEPRSLLDEVPTIPALGFRIIVHGIHSPLQLAVVANPAEQHHFTLIGVSTRLSVTILAEISLPQVADAELMPVPFPKLLVESIVMEPALI